jgi:hypothetical protein
MFSPFSGVLRRGCNVGPPEQMVQMMLHVDDVVFDEKSQGQWCLLSEDAGVFEGGFRYFPDEVHSHGTCW